MDTYRVTRDTSDPKKPIGCIDLVESFDDDGWYAEEYDFTRGDNSTRTSARIYSDRDSLVRALDSGKHKWTKWD
jgi:hypothetical protein